MRRSAAAMPEAALLDAVREACKVMGLRCYHVHDSRRSDPGFPDLVIVGAGRVLFRELKTAAGRLTAEQRAWLADLTRAGCDADVWRPNDWGVTGRIMTELRTMRRGQRSPKTGDE